MAEASGRDLVISIGSPAVAVATVNSKSIAVNNERVDTTSDDSIGWQSGLSTIGLKSFEASVSGYVSNDTLRGLAYGTSPEVDLEIEFNDTATLTGKFFITGYTESGESAGAIEFEATIASNGALTYTEAA